MNKGEVYTPLVGVEGLRLMGEAQKRGEKVAHFVVYAGLGLLWFWFAWSAWSLVLAVAKVNG